MNSTKKSFIVCVKCFTYNHEGYITKTLDGFAMQQTDFPFVCTIVDDASNDGEQDVILDYISEHFILDDQSIVRREETDDYRLLFSRHQDNPNLYIEIIMLKHNHYRISKSRLTYIKEWTTNAKYLAHCEGDDYWTDPRKLQMQIDYLESHNDCNLVYTDISTFYQKDGTMTEGFFGRGVYSHIKNTHKDVVLWGWFMAPCTWVYRNDIIKFPEVLSPNMFYGDLFWLLSLSENGSIHYINKITAVYRVSEESASHSSDVLKIFVFWKKCRTTRLYFASKQPLVFRLKWLFINESLALRDILHNRNYKIAKKTVAMMFEEIKHILF